MTGSTDPTGIRYRKVSCTVLLSAMLAALSPSFAAAQHDHGVEELLASATVEPEMPLLTKVTGSYTRPITTSNPLAQAYFDQGMQMVWAFTYSVAIRSFQEAQR